MVSKDIALYQYLFSDPDTSNLAKTFPEHFAPVCQNVIKKAKNKINSIELIIDLNAIIELRSSS